MLRASSQMVPNPVVAAIRHKARPLASATSPPFSLFSYRFRSFYRTGVCAWTPHSELPHHHATTHPQSSGSPPLCDVQYTNHNPGTTPSFRVPQFLPISPTPDIVQAAPPVIGCQWHTALPQPKVLSQITTTLQTGYRPFGRTANNHPSHRFCANLSKGKRQTLVELLPDESHLPL
jgi:hypothetical protein